MYRGRGRTRPLCGAWAVRRARLRPPVDGKARNQGPYHTSGALTSSPYYTNKPFSLLEEARPERAVAGPRPQVSSWGLQSKLSGCGKPVFHARDFGRSNRTNVLFLVQNYVKKLEKRKKMGKNGALLLSIIRGTDE